MRAAPHVAVINVDARGNYWRETLPTNDALLKLLRFLRKNPDSVCTIELRLNDRIWDAVPVESGIATEEERGVQTTGEAAQAKAASATTSA